MAEAPAGSVIVWESHYGYRPEWKNDVKYEDLLNNPNFKQIQQYQTPDKRFLAVLFEKIK